MTEHVATPLLRPRQRLALCVAAVFGLHAALLVHLQWHQVQFISTGAMTVRALPGPTETLTSPALAQAPLASPVQPMATVPLTQLPSAPKIAFLDTPRADAPTLRYPDSPLPGGQGQAIVALSLDADGLVSSLRIEPDQLPRRFEAAIELAFEGSQLTAELVGGPLAAGRLCVRVSFQEGTAPSWQRIAPAGICKR